MMTTRKECVTIWQITIEAAVKKLGITEEKFMEYSEEYNRQMV